MADARTNHRPVLSLAEAAAVENLLAQLPHPHGLVIQESRRRTP